MATSVISTHFSQQLLHNFHPRKVLLQTLAQQHSYSINVTLHTDAAIAVLALICTLISSFGLFCIVKCANRDGGSTSVAVESGVNSSPKLANVGVEQEALNAFPVVKYSTELKLPGQGTACVICLSEFVSGECLRILPKCNHGFHARCIDTWLGSHSSCPTCRHCLTETIKIDMKSLQLVETVN